MTLEQITKDTRSEFFTEGSFFEYMDSVNEDGQTNIYTIKDPANYTLVDAIDARTARYLSFQVLKCDNDTSAVECAYFGEQNEYLQECLSRYSLGLINLINYIDFSENVEPFKGPVK